MEAIILEQCFQTLLKNMRVWVRRHQPLTCEFVCCLQEEFVVVDLPKRRVQPFQGLDLGKKWGDLIAAQTNEKKKEIRGTPSRHRGWFATGVMVQGT